MQHPDCREMQTDRMRGTRHIGGSHLFSIFLSIHPLVHPFILCSPSITCLPPILFEPICMSGPGQSSLVGGTGKNLAWTLIPEQGNLSLHPCPDLDPSTPAIQQYPSAPSSIMPLPGSHSPPHHSEVLAIIVPL